jgi:hypothetical protein
MLSSLDKATSDEASETSEHITEIVDVESTIRHFKFGIGALSEKLSEMNERVGHTIESESNMNTKIAKVEKSQKEVDVILEDLSAVVENMSAEIAVLLRSRFLQNRFSIREMLKVHNGKKRKASMNVFQIAEAVEAEPDDKLRENYIAIFEKIFGYPITDVLE